MGRTAEAAMRLDPPEAVSATQTPVRRVPAVLATATLVHLAEMAAARLMAPALRHGESSVTVSTNLHHAAVSRLAGGPLRAVASAGCVEGRLHRFRVEVFDAGGLVASVLHTRAVVVARRVEALARRRAGQPAMLLAP